MFITNLEQLKKMLRFALIGGGATLVYGILAMIFSQSAHVGSITGHLLAYMLAIPLSFVGQRRVTFNYKGEQNKALLRFSLTSIAALALSTMVVWAIYSIGYPAVYGTVATMLILPTVSYLIMDFWVFRRKDED